MNDIRIEHWVRQIEAGMEWDNFTHEIITITAAAAVEFVNEYRQSYDKPHRRALDK